MQERIKTSKCSLTLYRKVMHLFTCTHIETNAWCIYVLRYRIFIKIYKFLIKIYLNLTENTSGNKISTD